MDNNKARELAAQAAKYAVNRMEGVTVDAATWREKYENIIAFEVRKAIETYVQEADKWVDLVEALKNADAEIQEEINYSNYDHETICRIGRMWNDAHSIIRDALARAEKMGVV